MMREVRGRIQYKKLALLLAGAALLPNLFDSAKIIEKEYGGICVPVPSDNPYEYWDAETMTGKGLLSMKHVAVAYGINGAYQPAVQASIPILLQIDAS